MPFLITEGGENSSAHGGFWGPGLGPKLELGDALREEHLDAANGGDTFASGKLQKLRVAGPVDEVHENSTV